MVFGTLQSRPRRSLSVAYLLRRYSRPYTGIICTGLSRAQGTNPASDSMSVSEFVGWWGDGRGGLLVFQFSLRLSVLRDPSFFSGLVELQTSSSSITAPPLSPLLFVFLLLSPLLLLLLFPIASG